MDNTFALKILKSLATHNPRGLPSAGITAEAGKAILNAMSSDVGIIFTLEPGDFIRSGDQDYENVSLGLPIAYDVWYLHCFESILPETKDESEEWVNDGRLKDFFDSLEGMKPLRGMQSFHSISEYKSNAPYRIKGMRFESRLSSQTFQHQSNAEFSSYPVYLAFPIGPLGVMEILSIIRETMDGLVDPDLIITEGSKYNMLCPTISEIGNCIGEHIFELAWKKVGDNVEYPASEFENLDPAFPHYWLRYWVKEDQAWPVPGEFVAMICRPLPYHVWWYQETCPFVYAGNWFETLYYTSGIVTEVIEPGAGEVGKSYIVKIKGEELQMKSTDLYEYEIGERVAVLKTIGLPDQVFNWQDLEIKGDGMIATDWEILPVSFYSHG